MTRENKKRKWVVVVLSANKKIICLQGIVGQCDCKNIHLTLSEIFEILNDDCFCSCSDESCDVQYHFPEKEDLIKIYKTKKRCLKLEKWFSKTYKICYENIYSENYCQIKDCKHLHPIKKTLKRKTFKKTKRMEINPTAYDQLTCLNKQKSIDLDGKLNLSPQTNSKKIPENIKKIFAKKTE